MSNLKKANAFFSNGNFARALEEYNRIIRTTPALERVLSFNINYCLSKVDGENAARENRQPNERSFSVSYRETDMHGKEIDLFPKPCYEKNGYSLEVEIDSPCQLIEYSSIYTNFPDDLSIGIQLHLYYIDILEDYLHFFKNISGKFTLYISLIDHSKKSYVEEILSEKFPNIPAKVKVFENRGRDISHFVVGFAEELKTHDVIGHFHSKRSPHNFAKADWRRQLVTSLMGSTGLVNRLMTLFSENPQLGMIFHSYHNSLKGQISWGTNFEIAKQTANQLGIEIAENEMVLFPAGSMFWARTKALLPLLNAGFSYSDFPPEDSQIDGTLAHAIERLFGKIVHFNGYDILQTKPDKQYNLIKYFPKKYPYLETPQTADSIAKYKREKKTNNKIVVFTALSGGYEDLPRHAHLDPSFDYVAFCDRPIDSQGFWEVRPMDFWHPDSVRMARRIKTNPHIYLKEYEIAIWIDANVIIEQPLLPYINKFLESKCEVASIHHPIRNCVYHEAKAIIEAKKDVSGRADRQMKFYREQGYPEYNGLTETNLMMSKLDSPNISRLMNRWWSEIVKFSHRDQLSFNYSLWVEGMSWHRLMPDKVSLRDNFDFAYLGHGRNSGYIIRGERQPNVVNPLSYESKGFRAVDFSMDTNLDIVICVHNALDEVKRCLDSVLKSRRKRDRIIIVDDGSANDTASFLENFASKNKRVLLLRNSEADEGYCKAANRGMEAVESEFFLLLNSDTILTKRALDHMKSTILRDKNIGIVGPMSNAASTQSIPNIANTENQTAVNNLPNGVTVDGMNALCEKWSHNTLMPSVPLVHGFCQLIRKSLFDRIGGFDEVAFPQGYGEENDFCLRAADAGFDLKICTKAFVYHEKSASYSDDERRNELMKRGSQNLKKKHNEDRLYQAIKAMEGHYLLEEMRSKANAYIQDR